ncbi:uncharacterized protein BCR38DRAFT_525375 [Pseudomassariella vexata]|uniref:Uncharacterized protein n=1 Tax=Pseudomassariella vexata TaxID=1141098 RepID=A0A1Y2DTA2_9PEZI|nr:uncharacterized protein BCR38DRAFT_525375 [Pseudomassariella vexata]ORY62366.1 hypothetical protein BCR38DRAFT_525375 [Pseudomassariella vexata]
MSTSVEVQLSTFNALRRAHRPALLSTDAKYLFWTLDGPLANSVSSITLHTEDLDVWGDQWLGFHRDHSEPDGSEENGDGSMVQ